MFKYYCVLYDHRPEQSDIYDAREDKWICCTKPTIGCLLPSQKVAEAVIEKEYFDDRASIAEIVIEEIDLINNKLKGFYYNDL